MYISTHTYIDNKVKATDIRNLCVRARVCILHIENLEISFLLNT